MKMIVCDLDGTLCNSDWRISFAQEKRWEEFHSRLDLDQPNEDVSGFLTMVTDLHAAEIVFCTGRPETYREETEDWLKKYHFEHSALLMRGERDYRSDWRLKPEILAKWHEETEPREYNRTLKQRVAVVLEDRDIMVKAWRALGLPCWQVRGSKY